MDGSTSQGVVVRVACVMLGIDVFRKVMDEKVARNDGRQTSG